MLYHLLQRVYPICTTRLLLYKITTFCPDMTRNSTAASITEAAVFICSTNWNLSLRQTEIFILNPRKIILQLRHQETLYRQDVPIRDRNILPFHPRLQR